MRPRAAGADDQSEKEADEMTLGMTLRAVGTALLALVALEMHWFWLGAFRKVAGADEAQRVELSYERKGKQAVALERLTVSLAPNASSVIGRDALAQAKRSDAAEAEHVEFHRAGNDLKDVFIRRVA